MASKKRTQRKKRKQRKVKLVSNQIQGTCRECGEAVLWRESWIVRPEIWAEAGMGGYFGSGLLHETCLEKRLGRQLVQDDLLVWFVSDNPDGGMQMEATEEGRAFLADKRQ